jgi:hypothetical protein
MRKLPIDKRGYPVPWFVAWVKGEPEFRAMDGRKWTEAVKFDICWVCGERLGKWKVFVIGPMCGINRTTSEPPSHRECAQWSARNCPFLTQREVKRREDEFTEEHFKIAGVSIKRNPGVVLVWTTLSYEIFSDGRGGRLIHIGDPLNIQWYSHGRFATRSEIIESIESGFPALQAVAAPQEMAALLQSKQQFEELFPET